MQHEQRMKQLENDILRVKKDSERIEERTKQIEKETEQLRQENAREKALSDSIRRLCFPPDSNLTQPTATESDCKPSLP
jgi:hypothetical protein